MNFFYIGGTLSGEYMRALFDDFVKAIKAELPNAIISWDISAWIGVDGFTQWLILTLNEKRLQTI